MQEPESKPAETPGVKTREERHDLTTAQITAISNVFEKLEALKKQIKAEVDKTHEFISFFVGYIVEENKLPGGTDAWGIQFEQGKAPYLVGHIPEDQ